MDSEELSFAKQYNVKIYSVYKVFSWDLLFYYAISFIFLTSVKHLDASQILLVEAIYTLFKFILQIPMVSFVDKLGKRKSLIIANVLLSIFVFLIMIAFNIQIVILANLFAAIAFCIKGITESSFLYDCIPDNENRSKLYSKIDGDANSKYYYLESVSSVITGFLAAYSPYLSLSCTLFFCVLSVYLASRFKDISFSQSETSAPSKDSIKNYLKDLKYSFRFILKSNRLKSLILFGGVFYGFLALLVTLRKSLLYDIQVPTPYLGILFAVFGAFSGVASSMQNNFHKRYRNKLLTYITMVTIISSIISGFVVILNLPNFIAIPAVLFAFTIQFATKGLYFVVNKKYLNSFSTSGLRTKIFSINNLFESLCAAITAFLCSKLLLWTDTAVALVIFSIVFLIVLSIILKYMKTRVGLKPEQYRKEDIPIPVK